MQLMREVRFSLVGAGPIQPKVTNSWAGWPSTGLIAPHLALRVTVSGAVDPRTGYLVNIAEIDRLVRDAAIPILQQAAASRTSAPALTPERIMHSLGQALAGRLERVTLESLELRATPYLRFGTHRGEPDMVTMTQSFEFAAAHRLYVPDLSEEENRRVFGKCTNPSGHGHNYVVEVTIIGEPDAAGGTLVDLPAFEALVKARVIDRFDHKHLNADCPEFARLNPTVENITRVIWDLLDGAFGRCRLDAVRVWETPKTYAEYRGSSISSS